MDDRHNVFQTAQSEEDTQLIIMKTMVKNRIFLVRNVALRDWFGYSYFMDKNNRIKIAVIDDDPGFRAYCTKSVQDLGYTRAKGFASLKEVHESGYGPDLLLCDICSGSDFTALKEIYRIPRIAPVVYISAYPEYLREAFGPFVLGFVEKRKMNEQLGPTISKACGFLENQKTVDLMTYYEKSSIPCGKIESIEIEQSRLCLYTLYRQEKIELTESSLKDCEDKIGDEQYLIINRNELVNVCAIEMVNPENRAIRLISGRETKVSRRKWQEFYRRYLWYK